MSDNQEKVGVSPDIDVTEEQAALLMTHHLQMAAAFWEATKADRNLRNNQVIREVIKDETWQQAASVYVEYLFTEYEARTTADGDDAEDNDET